MHSATRLQAIRSAAIGLLALAALAGTASGQMPDLREMSGRPLPSSDLAAGSVSVRVVRQTMGNNVPDLQVTLLAGGQEAGRSTTDAGGRALFTGLTPGVLYQVRAVVDGEPLESHGFTLPPSGGIRMLLAAGLGAGSAAAGGAASAAPARPGSLSLGGQSRLVFELADESVEVFALLDVINNTSAPASLQEPLVFELPVGAMGGTILQGSTAVAKLEGSRVIVPGPFNPGSTPVQFGYRVLSGDGTVRVSQALPLEGPQGTVIVRRFADVEVAVAGERGRREVPIEDRTYRVVTTGPLAAGGAIDVVLTGVPARSRWPQYVTLGLAAAIAAAGLWWTVGPAARRTDARDRLRAERASRFEELLAVERRLRGKGAADPELLAQRERLLEEVIELDSQLDDAAAAVSAGPDAGPARREQTSAAH